MHYQGGKAVEGKWIAGYLESIRSGRPYVEPFCGACGVMHRMTGDKRYAYDVHPDLIIMWRALQLGWKPPGRVTEAEYAALKSADPSPIRGFVGFGCSFGGKWFGGYARNKKGVTDPADYASRSKRSLLARLDGVKGVEFDVMDYRSLNLYENLIYCDPPYSGRTGYKGLPKFDQAEFWEWVREQSKKNTVVVSSFEAPQDFVSVSEFATVTCTRGKDNKPRREVEKLFVHKDMK